MCCKIDIYKIIFAIIILFLLFSLIIVCINCSEMSNKSILTAIAEKGDNTEVGDVIIKYSKNNIVEGNAISHQEGSSEFIINETGIYQISYQLYGVNNTSDPFNFNAVILLNNSPLNSTLNSSPVLKDNVNNRMTLTSTVILSLNAGDVIQLGGLSLESIMHESSRIDIVKIQ